jgi:hypothetical protein
LTFDYLFDQISRLTRLTFRGPTPGYATHR